MNFAFSSFSELWCCISTLHGVTTQKTSTLNLCIHENPKSDNLYFLCFINKSREMLFMIRINAKVYNRYVNYILRNKMYFNIVYPPCSSREQLKKMRGKPLKKSREWILEKKERRRRQGKPTRNDTKYSGRKRSGRFWFWEYNEFVIYTVCNILLNHY